MKELTSQGGDIIYVDDEDYPLLSRFGIHTTQYSSSETKYAKIQINESGFLLHRLIKGLPSHYPHIIDHINGNGLDNRKSNLRVCGHAENMRNSKKRKTSKYKYKGVRFRKGWRKRYRKDGSYRLEKRDEWRATIQCNGKTYRKRASSEIDAAKKYDEMAKKLHGEFALLNFPYGAPDEDKSYFENGEQSQLKF